MMATDWQATFGLTSKSGKGKPHNIMPPYVAMKACIKVDDTAFALIDEKINNIYDTFLLNQIVIFG